VRRPVGILGSIPGAAGRLAGVVALVVLAGLPGAVPLDAAPPADDGLVTKTFTARYRGIDEIVALIQPVVSERGSYAVQPRIRSVTVTDTAAAVGRMAELIAGFALPPRSVNLMIQLMLAEEGAPAETARPRPRRMGLPPAVIQDLTKWGVITEIGGASIATAEGEPGTVVLGSAPEEYRVRFEMGAVTPRIGVIRMERFLLERPGRPAGGGEGAGTKYVPLIDLVLNLKDHQTTVLGATSSQDSKQALFVSITATTQER